MIPDIRATSRRVGRKPKSTPPPDSEPPSGTPDDSWHKDQIWDWLEANGVTVTKKERRRFTKTEALDLVTDYLDNERDPADV